MVRISVVICTYNRERFLLKAFKSIVNQKYDKSLYEIILVNNNSTDNTEQISLNFKKSNPNINFKYFVEEQQGLSYARNRGIKESSGDIITFIDDDAHAEPHFLSKTVEYLDRNTEIAVVGGKIHLDYETEKPKWVTHYLESLFGYYDLGEKEKLFTKTKYPRGSNMSYRKTVFDKHGGFDVELGRKGNNLAGNEEKEIFVRIYNNGEKGLYFPDLLVYHAVPIERTKKEFIKKQAIGAGKSEWNRVKKTGSKNIMFLFMKEFTKWGASILLWLFNLLRFQPSKGNMLINFRYWVLQGITNSK
jgi:glucosyl-dolichyl phosphate glucuronosyltransferase